MVTCETSVRSESIASGCSDRLDRFCGDCPLAGPEGNTQQLHPLWRIQDAAHSTETAILLLLNMPSIREVPLQRFLKRLYVDAFRLANYADVYGAYAVRCNYPDTPPLRLIRACEPRLLDDIRTLAAVGYRRLVIVALGAVAAKSLRLGSTLRDAFRKQGTILETLAGQELPESVTVTVFATYSPEILLPGRQPSLLVAVRDHLGRVQEFVQREAEPSTQTSEKTSYLVAPDPSNLPSLDALSLDIETYGAVATYPPQRCFHPAKSLAFDGIRNPRDLIVTVAVAWEPDGAAIYDFRDPRHRLRLWRLLRDLRAREGTLIGMNLKFDLLYLRAADPFFKGVLRPPLKLQDLGVLNYLHSELRPERSLKTLAPLLGLGGYEEHLDLRHERYESVSEELFRYNIQDAVMTLKAVRFLEQKIRELPNSWKSSETCRSWYNRLLWTVLYMEEDGIAFDRDALDEMDFRLTLQGALIWSRAYHKYGLILSGPGSGTSKSVLFRDAAEAAGVLNNPSLAWTPKTNQIATSAQNANLILQYLNPDHPLAEQIRLQQEYEHIVKLTNSYTRPMLYGTRRNPILSRLAPGPRPNLAIAYPTWYPVPGPAENMIEGGTVQGRITSKGPACQTLPKPLKACLTTRYEPGFLICMDLSQIELRVAALLSGDPLMISEYQENVDRHSRTALRLIEVLLDWLRSQDRTEIQVGPRTYSLEELQSYLNSETPRALDGFDTFRQLGKTQNFLNIYGGSARKLQATYATDLGVNLPLDVLDTLIQRDRQRYQVLAAWQRELLERTIRECRLELPYTGQSRTFLGSRSSIRQTYTSEILNCPIQSTAANILLDIQFELRMVLDRLRRRVYMGLNIYDSLFLDGPLAYMGTVRDLLAQIVPNPPYYRWLQDHLAREVPIEYDITVLVQHDPRTGLSQSSVSPKHS